MEVSKWAASFRAGSSDVFRGIEGGRGCAYNRQEGIKLDQYDIKLGLLAMGVA